MSLMRWLESLFHVPPPRGGSNGRHRGDRDAAGDTWGSGEGTPIEGMNCTACGAPWVRTSTIHGEDGSTGTMPGGQFWTTPSCACTADVTIPDGNARAEGGEPW